MKRLALAGMAVLGLMVVGTPSADAGDFSVHIGSRGVSFGTVGHHDHQLTGRRGIHNPQFNHPQLNHSRSLGWSGHHPHRRRPHVDVWHNTSHYDYVPGHWAIVHGCRVWVPGRYVWHQDGHVDHVYRNHVHHGH